MPSYQEIAADEQLDQVNGTFQGNDSRLDSRRLICGGGLSP